MNKKYPIYIFIFSIILLNLFLLSKCTKSENNKANYFRIHIVANSNSIDDQIIKLNIAKKINNYINNLLAQNSYTLINDKEYAKSVIKSNIQDILDITSNELKNQNSNYTCYANIGEIKYNKKSSDILDMDKGIYDSIQIVLGNGKGENFWSLIFPYSYNLNSNLLNSSNIMHDANIEVKSGIYQTIKKVVKTFKS